MGVAMNDIYLVAGNRMSSWKRRAKKAGQKLFSDAPRGKRRSQGTLEIRVASRFRKNPDRRDWWALFSEKRERRPEYHVGETLVGILGKIRGITWH